MPDKREPKTPYNSTYMEHVTGIGGFFFKARDPVLMAAWYRETLGIRHENGHADFLWRTHDNSHEVARTVWSLFPADTDYFGPSTAPFMINYRVVNLDRMLEQLRQAGVAIAKVEDCDYGRFAWITDPEGHRIELWESKAESSTVTVAVENPNGEIATGLLHDLCLELSARYGRPPSPFAPDEALAPRTAFVVARLGAQPIGCGALRRIDDTTVELKRMYVTPVGRRRGVSRRILSELEHLAAGFRYRVIRLETGLASPEAIGLYESSGYSRIAPFGQYVGSPGSICFEKHLHVKTAASAAPK